MKTKDITQIALVTAITCILAPMSIQISIIPVTFTNLVIYLSAYILGAKKATISYAVYYILGIIGLPVFSGFSGGFAKAFGPTGGFLAGFFATSFITGLFAEKFNKKPLQLLGMVIGTVIAYILGALWYAFTAKTSIMQGFAVGVFPFVAVDLAKMLIALFLGSVLKKRIKGNTD